MIDIQIMGGGTVADCTLTNKQAHEAAKMLLTMSIPLYPTDARDGIAIFATTLARVSTARLVRKRLAAIG